MDANWDRMETTESFVDNGQEESVHSVSMPQDAWENHS